MSTALRVNRDGHPVALGKAFAVDRRKGDRVLHAVCALQTHELGFELVLTVEGLLSRSQVCRSRDEVLDVSDQWRAAMVTAGWQ